MSAFHSSTWQTLQSFPMREYSNMALLNDEECIVAPYSTHKRKGDGIYRYNINRFRWSLFIKYPKEFTRLSNRHTIAFDKKFNKVIIYSFNGTLTIIDVNTHKFEYFQTKQLNEQIRFAKAIAIGSHYHVVISTQSLSYHLIFDSPGNTFEFNECNLPQIFTLCYLKFEQRLLLYGTDKCTLEDCIMEYSFKANKWNELSKFKLSSSCSAVECVSSPSERYIILFYGVKKTAQNIYVLDLHHMTLKQSKINCPSAGIFDAVIMCNYKEKVLVMAYLKERCTQYNIHIPNDLKYLMLSFYQCLYLHLLDRTHSSIAYWNDWRMYHPKSSFWRVGADDILRELSD